jgi:hypothetical protein
MVHIKVRPIGFDPEMNGNTNSTGFSICKKTGFSICKSTSENPPKSTLINDLFKYQRWVLRVFGLYHHSNDHWSFKTYRIFIILLQMFSFIRFIFLFKFIWGESESFSALLVYKITTFLWSFGCTLNNIIFFFIHRNEEKIEKFGQIFEEIVQEFADEAKREIKCAKKIVITTLLISLILIASNILACLISIFGPKDLYEAFYLITTPFQDSEWAHESVVYKLFVIILFVYGMSSWFLPLVYFYNYCLVTKRLLIHFNAKFGLFIVKNEITIRNEKVLVDEEAFDELTKWQIKLTFLIRSLNTCFQFFIGLNIVVYIPVVFLLCYIMSDWTGNCVVGFFQFLYPFWLVLGLADLLIIILNAAKINTLVSFFFFPKFFFKNIYLCLILKAHAPLKDIFHIKTKKFSSQGHFQVYFFNQFW